jgi:hypothetical protein
VDRRIKSCQIDTKGGKTDQKNVLDACETTTIIQSGTSCFSYAFLGVIFVLNGGHIWKNHRTCLCEELELFRLLESKPYLFKSGRDRLSQRDSPFAL